MKSFGVRINKRRYKLREKKKKKQLITNNEMGMETELQKAKENQKPP